MVTVAQLVESQIVILVVAGSSPVGHPILHELKQAQLGNQGRCYGTEASSAAGAFIPLFERP